MAASFLGKLLVKIEGDNSDLDKSVKKSEGSVKKFSKLAVAAYAVVGVAIIAMAKKFSKAASDAAEIGSKFNTIFRDMKGDANDMADSFAKDFGLAGSSARELLGNTADLLTGFGLTQRAAADVSLATNELAADLASFSNAQGGAAAVSAALTSAYSGEREALKTYGIVINEAMIKAQLLKQEQEGLTFASEQQAKIAATLTLATQQSGNAIGDVARTFESHANVTRRLEESTKSLNEELGAFVNEGATPMLIIVDKLTKSMAEWFGKLNDVRTVLRELEEDSFDTEISLESLQTTLEILNKRTEQAGRGGSQQLRDQIAAVEELITNYDHVHDRINRNADAEQLYTNILKERANEATRIADIETEARDILLQLQFDSLSAEEQQIVLLNEEINRYAELRSQGADVQELLNELVRQRNELLTEEVEIINEVATAQDFMFDNGMVKIKDQSEAIMKLNLDFKSLAEDGLMSATSAFQILGEEGVTVWDALKQAGKDAISTFLKGLGQQLTVEALRYFSLPFGVGIPNGIAATVAASAAFAGAGLVQNLAEGGVLAPATGGVPAVMAEAGVPEMAMPLNSAATDPFADKIASRINSSTTNNTQNFNSMFSLNDENKLREAARRLFPFMRDEEQRRGITV